MRKLTRLFSLTSFLSLALLGSVTGCKSGSETASAVEPENSPEQERSERRGKRGERGPGNNARPDMSKFDVNGNGTLEDGERAAMQKSRATALVTELDSDGSGTLSKAEVSAASGRSAQALSDFAAVDTDADNSLSLDEVTTAMAKRSRPRDGRPPR